MRSRFFAWLLLMLVVVALAGGGMFYWRLSQERNEGACLIEEGRQSIGAQAFGKAIARFDAAVGLRLSAREKARALTWRGEAKNRTGALDAAISDLTAALKLNPGIGMAYAERARAEQAKNEKEKALADYDAAIAHGANGPENYLARGTLLFEAGKTEKAAADFEEATQRAPDNANAFILRGRALAKLENVDAAIASYESALRLDPQNQEARSERGDLYSKKGDVEKAMADYGELRTSTVANWEAKSAAAPTPFDSSEVVVDLLRQADSAQALGHLDEAMEIYNRVLRMNIPLTSASSALQHRKGDDEHAMQDYNLALRFDPANAGAYMNRGLLFALKNDSHSAMMDYNEALRFDSTMYQALYNRALAHQGDGDLEAAARDLTETLKLNNKFAPALLTRAGILVNQKKIDQGMADIDAAIKSDPELAPAYLARAQLLSSKHAYARALQDFEKAISLKSTSQSQALNGLAWIRATAPDKSVRDGKAAITAATRACELTGWNDGGLVDTLAAAFAEEGDFEKAVNFQYYALTLPGIGPELQKGAEERLALYQSHRPYRDEHPQ